MNAGPQNTAAAPLVRVCDKIKRKYYKTVPSSEVVIGDVCYFVFANWDKLEPLWNAQIVYAADEGLHPRDLWNSKMLAQLKKKR